VGGGAVGVNRVGAEENCRGLNNNIHIAQVITYLKMSDCRLGYVLNFNSSKKFLSKTVRDFKYPVHTHMRKYFTYIVSNKK